MKRYMKKNSPFIEAGGQLIDSRGIAGVSNIEYDPRFPQFFSYKIYIDKNTVHHRHYKERSIGDELPYTDSMVNYHKIETFGTEKSAEDEVSIYISLHKMVTKEDLTLDELISEAHIYTTIDKTIKEIKDIMEDKLNFNCWVKK